MTYDAIEENSTAALSFLLTIAGSICHEPEDSRSDLVQPVHTSGLVLYKGSPFATCFKAPCLPDLM